MTGDKIEWLTSPYMSYIRAGGQAYNCHLDLAVHELCVFLSTNYGVVKSNTPFTPYNRLSSRLAIEQHFVCLHDVNGWMLGCMSSYNRLNNGLDLDFVLVPPVHLCSSSSSLSPFQPVLCCVFNFLPCDPNPFQVLLKCPTTPCHPWASSSSCATCWNPRYCSSSRPTGW